MDQGEDTCRDKKQDETDMNTDTESERPILGQHEEPGLSVANRVRLPTSVAV
jgi:hypothetical protein